MGIATSIQLIQLQFLHKSGVNVKAKVMIWMGMSSKCTSDHQSKQAVNQEAMHQSKTIAPNIIRIVLAKADYSNIVQEHLTEKNNLPFISRVDHPLKLVQLRLKIYENN